MTEPDELPDDVELPEDADEPDPKEEDEAAEDDVTDEELGELPDGEQSTTPAVVTTARKTVDLKPIDRAAIARRVFPDDD